VSFYHKPAFILISLVLGLHLSAEVYAQKNITKPTPVLFVHGSGLNSNTWDNLKDYLIYRGYPAHYLYAVDIKPNNMSNIDAARSVIAPAAARLIKETRIEGQSPKIDIVAHSMGALSARWYASLISPESVRRVITIAGANHGTNTLCNSSAPGDREMCPAFSEKSKSGTVQSKLNHNRELNYDETPYGLGADDNKNKYRLPPSEKYSIIYFTIYIKNDEWIKPENSALLAGAGAGNKINHNSNKFEETSPGNYLFKKHTLHDDLPKDPEIMRTVYKMLINELS